MDLNLKNKSGSELGIIALKRQREVLESNISFLELNKKFKLFATSSHEKATDELMLLNKKTIEVINEYIDLIRLKQL